MQSAYVQLLDSTIRYLEHRRNQGQRQITVSAEAVRALFAPVQKISPPTATSASRAVSKISPAVRRATMPQPPLPATTIVIPAVPVTPQSQLIPISPNNPDKVVAYAELRKRVLACVKCPHLVATRKSVVFGTGNIDAQLMFVGEAPGADEDEQGEPFVGKAGQLLTKIIETMGLKRSDVYIANVLKCRPDTPQQKAGNRQPTDEEMATCLPYLHEQIDLIQPKVLVALGAVAIKGLLGCPVPITKSRGHWMEYRGLPLMPTFHPAYLLRTNSMKDKRAVWEDMLQVMEKLDLPISSRQRGYFSLK